MGLDLFVRRAETWKWLLSIFIGATMGLLAFLVDWGIDALNGLKFTAVRRAIAGAGEPAVGGVIDSPMESNPPRLTDQGIELRLLKAGGGFVGP